MVCGKEGHFANQNHSDNEVKEVVWKLKDKQYTEFFTEEDIAYISEMFAPDEAFEVEGWNGDIGYDEDQEEDGEISYVAEEDLADIQSTMTNSEFLYGRTVHEERN